MNLRRITKIPKCPSGAGHTQIFPEIINRSNVNLGIKMMNDQTVEKDGSITIRLSRISEDFIVLAAIILSTNVLAMHRTRPPKPHLSTWWKRQWNIALQHSLNLVKTSHKVKDYQMNLRKITKLVNSGRMGAGYVLVFEEIMQVANLKLAANVINDQTVEKDGSITIRLTAYPPVNGDSDSKDSQSAALADA